MEKENKKIRSLKKIILSIILILVIIIIGIIVHEILTINNKYYIGEKNLQIPIFVYHNIVENESEIEFDYMQTTADTFETQISGLMKLGYVPISYQDLVDYKNGEKSLSKRSFLITFDDGLEGVYDYAYPIAKKYEIPITIFEIDSTMNQEGCLTWEEAKEMKESGFVSIYLHGLEHLEYDKEPTEKLVSQTNIAYNNLTEKLEDKNILKVFTYPYGLHTEDDIEALKNEGYIQNLTDNLVNQSSTLNLSKLHRCYPLNDSVLKIILKLQYRSIRYTE